MTTIFFKRTIWVLVASLASVLSLPGIESSATTSASDYSRPRASNPSSEDYSGEQLAGYRFGDEFFNHPSAETAEASEPAEISGTEAAKKVDGCERVFKDSMICMVCKDPKTHSKYEQCSYVARPQEKHQSYGSSRSYSSRPDGGDRARADGDEERQRQEGAAPYGSGESEEAEEKPAATLYNSRYSKDDEEEEEEESEEKPKSTTSTYSRYTNDDSSERPEYRNKNNGGDEGRGENYSYGKGREYAGDERQPGEYDDERLGESSYESPNRRAPKTSSKAAKNEDKKGNKKQENCREVQKDSMTCTICKDPSNGGNFEKCSYSHQPNDRLYKYSKSKSFGYPGESVSSAQESKQVDKIADPKGNKNYRCQRLRKNSTTVCKICRDSATGAKSEQCEYNLKPALTKRQISRTAGSAAIPTSS